MAALNRVLLVALTIVAPSGASTVEIRMRDGVLLSTQVDLPTLAPGKKVTAGQPFEY